LPISLSILDFGPVNETSARERLLNLRRQVRVADDRGYARYWLGEHHVSGSAWAGPDLLLPALAETTQRIRLGAAGVLLLSRSPARVANDFSLASNLYPNRIDLGIGRGTPGQNTKTLAEEPEEQEVDATSPEVFYSKLAQLLVMLAGKSQSGSNLAPIPAIPVPLPGLEVWLLGSHLTSMRAASAFGTALSYSLFHGRTVSGDVLDEYRQEFRPGLIREPKINIAVAGYCAATESAAREQHSLHRNEFIHPTVVGDARQCSEQLLVIAEEFSTNEIVFLNLLDGVDSRCDALVLLSEHLGFGAFDTR
jgi:luciferase family oxidoreductase group 1